MICLQLNGITAAAAEEEGGGHHHNRFLATAASTLSDEGSPYHKLGRGGRRTNCSDWISGLEGKGFKISERVDLILAK